MAAERETDRPADRASTSPTGSARPSRAASPASPRSGLFVKLDETGADGFMPAVDDRRRLLPLRREPPRARRRAHAARRYRLGDRVEVKLVEAAPVAGALRFELLSEGGVTSPRRGRLTVSEQRARSRRARRSGRTRDASARRKPGAAQVRARQARPASTRGSDDDAHPEPARAGAAAERGARLSQAMRRGFVGRCPACGEGRLFGRFLKVGRRCAACGEPNSTITAPTTCRPTSSSSSSATSSSAGCCSAETDTTTGRSGCTSALWPALTLVLSLAAAAAGEGRCRRPAIGASACTASAGAPDGARAPAHCTASERRRRMNDHADHADAAPSATARWPNSPPQGRRDADHHRPRAQGRRRS